MYLDPKESCLFIEGTILKMEFLHPPQGDPFQVILLLVSFRQGKARLIWYEWDSRDSLRKLEMQPNGHALTREEYSPLLLIPLTMGAAFVLVCEARMAVYKDILTGTPGKYIQSLRNTKAPEEPGISKRFPLWTQWARPVRLEVHREDAIYLCREDGIVQYLEFRDDSDDVIDSNHQAGRLGVNVNTAFAVLDVGPNTMDLLVAGGDTSEGGLWRVWARQDPKLLHSIPNWTPLRSLTDVRCCGRQIGDSKRVVRTSPYSQRLFACTGKGERSAISELRYGYAASEVVSSEITGDIIQSGVLGFWAFHGFFGDPKYQFEGPESRNDGTYIIISHPVQTSLVHIRSRPMNLKEKDAEMNRDTDFSVEAMELSLPSKTISAGTTAKGLLILVTETSILVSSISAQELKEDPDNHDVDHEGATSQQLSIISSFEFPNTDARIIAASFHHGDDESVIVLALQIEECFSLQLGHLVTEYEPLGEPLQLPYRPSCVHLQRIGNLFVAFVATLNCDLYVFRVDGQGWISSHTGPYNFGGHFAICDSIAIIQSVADQPSQPKHLLVCGLRNGTMQTLHYMEDAPSGELTRYESLTVGTTSVSVVTDTKNQSRAFLHCEQFLFILEYPQGVCFKAPARVHGIWITDRDRPALQQGILSAFTQVVDSWLPRGVPGLTFGFLVCLDGNRLRVVKVDDSQKPHMVPRSLQIQGSPERMIYSNFLNRLIVLFHKLSISSETYDRGHDSFTTRNLHAFIAFLDPDVDLDIRANPNAIDIKQEDRPGKSENMLPFGRKPTERCIGMMEWYPKIDGNQHHMLIVTTKSTPDANPRGRLLFCSLPQGIVKHARVELKKAINLDSPAYSVAAFPDQNSIAYCSGDQLCVLSIRPSPAGIKFNPPVKAEIRSVVRKLSIHGSWIYLSSARESLSVFTYADDKLVYQFGDQLTREGLNHILMPEISLVLASDMTSTVVGLWQPPERRADNAMITVFEAILPSSISHFQRVDRPIWDRNPDCPVSLEDQGIIGSSEDGTITQFEIISKGWRLLRFIQNMAERNQLICPFKGRGPYKRHVDPSTTKPHYMHINGDILQRVLDRGAEGLIRDMLDVEPDRENHTDFDSAGARWKRFKELADEVVDTGDGDGDYLGKVVQWIRYQMRSAL